MTIPTIDHIETTIFRLPMAGALQWGKGSVLSEVRHVLVQVTLSDGSTGMAEAPPRPTIYGETPHSITSVIRDELAPRIQRMPVLDENTSGGTLGGETCAHNPLAGQAVRQIQTRLHEVKANQTAKGALDMALHDALAAHHGISLAAYLGVDPEKKLVVSYILGIGDRDQVLEEAARVVDQGVRVLKVKVGRDWQEDLAKIGEIQDTVGDTVSLYADANECMSADNASTILAALAERGLLYCEEPLLIEEIAQRARLRARHILPLIADDSAFSMRDLRRELAFDTFDILNIKTARTGYTESDAMRRMAFQAGKGVMVGSQAGTGIGTAQAALFAAWPGIDYPSELSFFLKLREDIIDRPLRLCDGYLQVRDVAGVSVDPLLLRDAAV